MLSVERVTKCYGNLTVLEDISLDLAQGVYGLLAPNGAGKSTLMKMLATLLFPTKGRILWDGEEIVAMGERYRGLLGYLPQDFGYYPNFTGMDFMMYMAALKGYGKSSAQKKARELLELVSLTEKAKKKIKTYSGGMKQRCAIAQAFSIDPPILLMDEPFGALDAVTRAKLQDLVGELWSRQDPKKTVFFVTHDVDEALLIGNRIVVLGQSPSNIIYECRLSEEQRPARETQFDNPETLKLRNELILQINKDVATHIS